MEQKLLPKPKSISDFHNDYHKTTERRFITGSFILSKNDILETLKHDVIVVNGIKCKTPEEQLIHYLTIKSFGSIQLDLEII